MKHNFTLRITLLSSRKSNLECLRIIAILMIIAYHYVVHSNFDFLGGWKSKAFLEFISYGGKAGVNIFCLLMGYFGVKSKFSVKKRGCGRKVGLLRIVTNDEIHKRTNSDCITTAGFYGFSKKGYRTSWLSL